jgi:hypothetical protein
MESGLTMLLHAVIIGVVSYLVMAFGFGLEADRAQNRSILIASVVLVYMILFGHGLPVKLNKKI